ncbi:MAG: hypothetical protein C4522_06470 [Desulfobacteraceae bacterium]|nr:MAG: hypothetical protein C4522_06470 [Desulfobacteraceae bacterium]
MPLPDQPEYNPNIIGFTEEQGPVFISLQDAKARFGELPSNYQLVSMKDGRQLKKVLNLALGKMITEKLKPEGAGLKKTVFHFFQNWHRDWKQEFGVRMEPFFNLNNPKQVHHILTGCKSRLFPVSSRHLRTYLAGTGLLRKDILNSIPDTLLIESAERILKNKQAGLFGSSKSQRLQTALTRIRTHHILARIQKTISGDLAAFDQEITAVFADEIAHALYELSSDHPIPQTDHLIVRKGKGVEFEFASRDLTYLMLGKETGDCTADKTPFQADRNIENIYWTVFPWILDRNYQILKVYYDGRFVLKVHMLPLYISHENMDKIVLAVDAVETIRAFRDDLPEFGRPDLWENRKEIFHQALQKIIAIGNAMGIEDIYAEKFSNTFWVRDYLNDLPEIFLHVNNLIKLDELEDVFCLSQNLCEDRKEDAPKEIFMEIQMKNTSLLPSVSKRNNAIKSFAVIKGDTDDGIPMKKIIGI